MKFIEFFAGAGLINLGIRCDGWECLLANDICQDKKETYIANFGKNHFHLGDIWNLAEQPDLISDEADLYTASFPCTDMSLAGERRGLQGKESATLNALFEIVQHKKNKGKNPKIIMLENVQGFLTAHHGQDIQYTVQRLNQLGYVVDIIELDAVRFTPQSRARIFLFGVQKEHASAVMTVKTGDILDPWFSLVENNSTLRTDKIKKIFMENGGFEWGAFNIPLPPPAKNNLSSVIDTTENSWWNEERKNHLYNQMNKNHQDTISVLMKSRNPFYGTIYRRTRNGKPCAELRIDGIAGCLRTPRGGSSKQILVRAGLGTWSARLLSPREYARLQGVDDSFILPSSDNKAYFAMGDAVCVPAISFISKHILTPAIRRINARK